MQPRPEPRLRYQALLLVALAGAVYANSFSAIPQYDDYSVIVDNAAVRSLAAWWQGMPGIRPLLKLSFALNNSGGGMAGFHAVNLLLHLFNAVLVLLLLRRLLPAASAPAAAVAALLFALHPVNTEAVTMLSGRSVSMMSAFFLLSLLSHLHGRRLGSLLAFAAAVATRETALVLPAALALLVFRLDCARGTAGLPAARAALRSTRWHWLGAALGVLLVLALPRYRELLSFSLALRDPLDNLVTQAAGILYLLGQLLRPWSMNADPQLPVFAGWSPMWAMAVAFWVLLGCWSLRGLNRAAPPAVGLLWLLVVLAPGNSLIARLDVASERQLYLAALPAFVFAGVAWQRLLRRAPALALALAGLVLLSLGAATAQRNTAYHSERAFWGDVTLKSPGNARAWNNLGFALEREQPSRPSAALAAYERAIAIDPGDFKARFNRRRLCTRSGLRCAGMR